MITKHTEWEGEHVRLVRLGGLPGKGYGRRRNGHPVELLFVHQSAGNSKEGIEAAQAIANYHTAPPKYATNPDGTIAYRTVRGKRRPRLIGGGRGWPGCGYTFVVPGIPEVVDGKIEVYRMNADDRHTYHTGGYHNRVGAAVCFAGTFASRHTRGTKREREKPEPDALLAGFELILDYLLPRYGIDAREGLKGHFDAGKPACPGDFLEQWVRFHRGESVDDPMLDFDRNRRDPVRVDPNTITKPNARTFDTIAERQQALVDLGFDLGPWGPAKNGVDGSWGEASKGALIAFQTTAEITVDGRWGNQTEAAIRLALAALAAGAWPPGD